MNILKNNIKVIVSIIILILIFSGISVFATYNYIASDIKYTDNKTVTDALNDLYGKMSKNDKVVLSINQTVSLTTSYTSTTSPFFYNTDILSYNSETNTYTFLKDFNGKLYISQGWLQGITGSKMNVQVNDINIIDKHHFENTSSAFNYVYEFKKDDTLKFYSKFDASSTTQVPIAISLIKL